VPCPRAARGQGREASVFPPVFADHPQDSGDLLPLGRRGFGLLTRVVRHRQDDHTVCEKAATPERPTLPEIIRTHSRAERESGRDNR
jgi:hypothetical protein